MDLSSETDGEIPIAKHGADTLGITSLVFDDSASRRTGVSAALVVVICMSFALKRARQSFGVAATDTATDRFGNVDLDKLSRSVETHQRALPLVAFLRPLGVLVCVDR
ncbi:hypothetical protein C450_20641 [Halococcus salifodinae DSM 8989]|uniref:Uncharacterized protein n=1 Tax=Halococcus salifodinae DSM 8989 TaxID=1227456 RepID=M0MTF8_9EURY|nr:hypothetical protein C450_20641 [Halococcus salifodinae DSM 8989]